MLLRCLPDDAATKVYVTSGKFIHWREENDGRSMLLKCIFIVHLDWILKFVVDKQKPAEKCLVCSTKMRPNKR